MIVPKSITNIPTNPLVLGQGANPACEEWREHTVPVGGQQMWSERQAEGAADRVQGQGTAVGRAVRGDLRQDPWKCRQGECLSITFLTLYTNRDPWISVSSACLRGSVLFVAAAAYFCSCIFVHFKFFSYYFYWGFVPLSSYT